MSLPKSSVLLMLGCISLACISFYHAPVKHQGMIIIYSLPRGAQPTRNHLIVSKKTPMVSVLPPPTLLSNLHQYIEGVTKLPLGELQKIQPGQSVKKKVPSSLDVSSLEFDVTVGADNYKNKTNSNDDDDDESNSVRVRVRNKYNNITVPGCNFNARQQVTIDPGSPLELDERTHAGGRRVVAECSVEELPDHSHRVLCAASHGAKCYHLTIILRFCHYEAFSHEPRIKMWHRTVLDRELCHHTDAADGMPAGVSPSWLLDNDGHCKRLMLHDKKPLTIFSPEESCSCIGRFDNVYLIGTSHMRYFADYLIHTCMGKDLQGYSSRHSDLHVKTVHYLGWCLFHGMHVALQKHLDTWLQPNSSIALWIQTGSWDFVHIHYQRAMEIGLELFNQTLAYINSRIANSSTHVDFRIIATSPMPRNWYWNNFAIAAFNARLHLISVQHGVPYTDAFTQQLPCCDDFPNQEGNGNHYFIRYAGNNFTGEVGRNVYFGAFLPQVCPELFEG